MGPLDGVLGRHALHDLGVHVDDDVLGHGLGRRPAGRPGMAHKPTGERDRPEGQHYRVVVP